MSAGVHEQKLFEELKGGARPNMILVIGSGTMTAGKSRLTEMLMAAIEEQCELEKRRVMDERQRQFDSVIIDELADCTVKPRRKSYHSPYYPQHCKARKGKR